MATTPKRRPAAKRAASHRRDSLPTITLGKLETALELVEEMVDEHTETFVRNGQLYKDRHHDATRRPLNAVETAQIAAGLGATLQGAQEQIDEAGLTVYDEPQPTEVLMAAGVATGTAFLATAKRLACLIELPNQEFEQAVESDTLHQLLDEHVKGWRNLALQEARERAGRAMQHFAQAAGFDSGKAVALAGRAMWNGLWQAMSHLDASGSKSSTLSAASTDGPAGMSSTAQPGPMSAS